MRNDEFIPVKGETYTVQFCSRTKDNKNVEGFRKRSRTLASNDPLGIRIMKEFDYFVSEGVDGEMCRMYVSLNAKNVDEAETQLAIWLLNKNQRKQAKNKTVESQYIHFLDVLPAKTHMWFFDFDCEESYLLDRFIADIENIDPSIKVKARKTPHGWAVWTNHGFDTRSLEGWGGIAELQRENAGARIFIKSAITGADDKSSFVKISKIEEEAIVFTDGSRLYSDHYADCCEWHWLDFGALSENKFVSNVTGKSINIFEMEFDFSDEVPFTPVEDMGILLKDVQGNKYLVCGHGSNNGFYGTNIELVYEDAYGRKIYSYDVSECQNWEDEDY